jgi:predicted porin
MTRSLKVLALTAAGLGLFASAVQAQDNTQLYGLLDMSAGRFQEPGMSRVWRAESGRMSMSFIGIKGTDDLGGGLRARYQLDHYLRVDTGLPGRFTGDGFWSRNALVGLSGAFGTTTLGRQTTPLFVTTLLFNAFGDSFGFSPSIRQIFAPALLPFHGDTAWSNSIAYASPDNGGWTINLMANLGEGTAGSTGKNFGASVMYFNGPLGATVAWQQVRNGAFATPAGWRGQGTLQFGASYDLNVAKLFGQYTEVKDRADIKTKTTLYSFGASIALGPGKLLTQYGSAKATGGGADTSNKTLSIGYDYALSKNTDVYAVFMNDKVSNLSGANTLAAGARLRF